MPLGQRPRTNSLARSSRSASYRPGSRTAWIRRVRPTTPPGAAGARPALSALIDDFSTADTTKWVFDANASISAGRVEMSLSSVYRGLTAVNRYDMRNSGITVELVRPPDAGNGSTEAEIRLFDTTNRMVRWIWSGSDLVAQWGLTGDSGPFTTVIRIAPHVHATQRFLRITEAAGVITWWTSPDASTWTSRGTWTYGSSFTPGDVQPSIKAGYWGTETAPGTAVFDNLNIPYSDQYGQVVHADQPVWWTRANGSTVDETGGTSGTLNNTATYGPGILPARPGSQAFELNHSFDAQVSFPDQSKLDIAGPFTAELWARTDVMTTGGAYRVAFAKQSAWAIEFIDGFPEFYIEGGSAATSTNALLAQTTYHIVGVYDGSSLLLYVNGVLQPGAVSYSSGVNTNNLNLYLGTWSGADYTWDGQIAEAAVYNRPLTAAEIREHYYAGVVSDPYGRAVAADDPVFWARGNGSLTDETGGTPGTLNGGTTYGSSLLASRPTVQSFNFDGVDDFVSYPDQNKLDITEDISLEFWFQADTLPSGYHHLVGKNSAYFAEILDSRVEWQLTNPFVEVIYNSLVAGRTYHYVGTRTGGTARLYINGVEVATAASSGSLAVTAQPLRIGSWDGISEFFDGRIAEAAIYNRALTSTEVAEHYDLGVSAPGNLLTGDTARFDTSIGTWIETLNAANFTGAWSSAEGGVLRYDVTTAGLVGMSSHGGAAGSPRIAVTPGQSLLGSIRVKKTVGTSTQVRLDVQFYDAAGAVLTAYGVNGVGDLIGSTVNTTTSWQTITGDIVVPTGAATVRLRAWATGTSVGDVFLWDDAYLTYGSMGVFTPSATASAAIGSLVESSGVSGVFTATGVSSGSIGGAFITTSGITSSAAATTVLITPQINRVGALVSTAAASATTSPSVIRIGVLVASTAAASEIINGSFGRFGVITSTAIATSSIVHQLQRVGALAAAGTTTAQILGRFEFQGALIGNALASETIAPLRVATGAQIATASATETIGITLTRVAAWTSTAGASATIAPQTTGNQTGTIEATGTATSTVGPLVQQSRALAATAVASSTIAQTTTRTGALVATATATAATVPALAGLGQFIATGSASALVSFTITRTGQFTSTAAASASVSGLLSVSRTLTVVAAASSEVSGLLIGPATFISTAVASTALVPQVSALSALVASAQAFASANVVVYGVLSSTAIGTSTIAREILRTGALTATATASETVSAQLAISRLLIASAVATPDITVVGQTVASLTATAVTSGAIAPAITRVRALAATAAASGAISVVLAYPRALTATASGTAAISPVITVNRALTGTAGASAVIANVTITGNNGLISNASATASIAVQFVRTGSLTVTGRATSTISADTAALLTGALIASGSATVSISVQISINRTLAASAASTVQLGILLSRVSALNATASGSGDIAPLTSVIGLLAATAVALVTAARQHQGSTEITVEWTVTATGATPATERFGSSTIGWSFEVTGHGLAPRVKVSLVVSGMKTRRTDVGSLQTRTTQVSGLESRTVRASGTETRTAQYGQAQTRALVTHGVED